MGYYLSSGRVADVLVMPGIGEECLHPALQLARREGVPIGGWLAPDAPPDTPARRRPRPCPRLRSGQPQHERSLAWTTMTSAAWMTCWQTCVAPGCHA